MEYDDCPCGNPTFEVRCKNGTDLTELYSLNEYQKTFATHVTFEVELIDTFNVKVNYYDVPTVLITDFDLDSFNEEINEALVGKLADYIITHLTVMKIVMSIFNSHLIGICLGKDVENRMIKQIERMKKIL